MSLVEDIEALSRIGRDGEGISRFAWTPELAAANHWLLDRLAELGMAGELDPAGNVIGRWSSGAGGAILVGSHLDTVPRGGRFDGALGVLAALEAVRILKRDGVQPRRPIWIAAFNDEEGARFRTSMLGSRAFIGELDLDDLRTRGVPEAMAAAGLAFDRLIAARRIEDVDAYLELHIEQGPVLEEAGTDIGVVTAIVGLLGLRVRFLGQANHAGTTPMRRRRDALAGAARAVLALREEALARDDVVATVGQIRVEPGAANVVPGLAEIGVDLRAPTEAGFGHIERVVRDTATRIAAEEGLEVEVTEAHRKHPVTLDSDLQATLRQAAALEGATQMALPSGAGHDAMLLARKVPAAMLFVPSRGGISHNPAEYTSPEHCERGARVLARALRLLVAPS
jgi:hydantoinase/carbamoylase family amidase